MESVDCSKIIEVTLSVDEIGKVFFYNDRVFRGIYSKSSKFVMDLINSGLIAELVNKKYFPETWINNEIKVDGFEFIIEHKKIKFLNYAYEWSFEMLKDAAILILEINQIANKYGYELKDPHADNIIFDFNTPKYVDLGSFSKNDNCISFSGWEIFNKHFFIPLTYYQNGLFNSARNIHLMANYINMNEYYLFKKSGIFKLVPTKIFLKLYTYYNNIQKLSYSNENIILNKIKNLKLQKIIIFLKRYLLSNIFTINKLKKRLQNIKIDYLTTRWGDYHEKEHIVNTTRALKIIKLINSFDNVENVLDIGANQGEFASLILEKTKIKEIIATDYDELAVNKLYSKSKHSKNVLPLVLDLILTNGRINDVEIAKRINADIVLVLAITHHLILTQKYEINYILKRISQFSKKIVFVEFMPLGLFDGKNKESLDVPSFYTLEWFKNEFTKYFVIIYEERVETNRYLFVGEKLH